MAWVVCWMERVAQPWNWVRLAANQPSPVRKVWGFAVCASRMIPNPSS